jgi:hypothetical protein
MFAATLVMIFICGCWTLATVIGRTALRPYSLGTVTVANVAFLLALMLTILSYADLGNDATMQRAMAYVFSVGILALAVSVILFSASALTGPLLSGRNGGPMLFD